MVKKGIVLTPHADYCLPGITRATVSIIRFQLEQLGQSIQVHPFHSDQVFLRYIMFYLCTNTLSEAQVVSQYLNYVAHLYTIKICSGKYRF
jgi:branched-subunit amino acid aminotransferase/4-amino-4-deoxychorismate lyase